MEFWENIWNIIWLSFSIMVFFAYLIVLFQIIVDLFRDRELSGWMKTLWMVGLIFIPLITSVVYLLARGRGMADRELASRQAAQESMDNYVRSVAKPTSAEEIAKAKELLEAGAITEPEFVKLKDRALASV
ncbi:SHOCT domain-containing protein [Arthrobacter antioxidans]|uniref:SHOCT domain-containing protein n=1 Tax=Arthrobacter antioxidans TaxID=2895818 RepID=UPI001FFE93F4|nr:SHOCT domain-containing protein [Arthrobacter antioxidans]